MNALEEQPREVTEPADACPGRTVIGFRLGDCMEDPDLASLAVFRSLFGGMMDTHKGLLLIEAGPDGAAKEEIFQKLESLRRGEIPDEALREARAEAAAELRAMEDDLGELEGFWLSQILRGLDYGPAELAELCEDVTKDDLIAVAQSLDCDLIYLLAEAEEEPAEAEEASEEEKD